MSKKRRKAEAVDGQSSNSDTATAVLEHATGRRKPTNDPAQDFTAEGMETPSRPEPGVSMHVLIEQLQPHPDNPRRVHDEKAIEHLAASIRSCGIIQPLVVRTFGDDPCCFQIVCGHRRWQAARLADLARVPCIVRSLTDEACLEVMIVENLEREDVHPLDEAAGIERLRAAGWDNAMIASKLGRSENWVAKRIGLLKLTSKWRDLILKGDKEMRVAEWPAVLLEEIARLSPAHQDGLLKDHWHLRGVPTLSELRHQISNDLGLLAHAKWDLDDATLVPKAGSCTDCTKRTGQDATLWEDFEDDGPKGGRRERCLDRACFDSKQAAFVELQIEQARVDGKALQLLMDEGTDYEYRKRLVDRGAVHIYSVQAAKKSEKGAKQALIVSGNRAGETMWVKPAIRSSGSGSGSGEKKPAKPAAEVRELRRRAWILKRMHELLIKPADEVVAHWMRTGVNRGKEIEALICIFGLHVRYDRFQDRTKWRKRFDAIVAEPIEDRIRRVLGLVLPNVADALRATDHAGVEALWPNAEPLAELCGIDLAELQAQALEEIPEPGRATLADDEEPAAKKKAGKRRPKPAAAKAPKPAKSKQAKRPRKGAKS